MRWLFAVVLALVVAAPAYADSLGAWTYTAPQGFKVENAKGRKAYTRVEGTAFCLVGVYEPRPATNDVAADLKKEWTDVIEAQFTASEVNGYPPKQTRQQLTKHTVGAKLKRGQQEFYGQLVIVRGGGVVGSVVIMAANANSISACHPAANVVMDSIVVGAPVAEVTAPASVSIVGTWAATSSATDAATQMSLGSQIRQYVFNADGTYAFHMEAWGGSYQANQWYVVDESGTYKIDGTKVTVKPKSVKGVIKNDKGGVVKKSRPPSETVAYQWQLHYFEGIKETQLVMTPPKQTARDGALGNNAQFPKSVLYSGTYNPEWRYPL